MTTARVVALLVVLLGPLAAAAQQPSRPVDDQQVYEVASELRCVVCQNLSVADSPSEMATQMRAIVRERLAAGQTPAQVRQYFVERYGEWILLSPPRRGFNLVVWLAPLVAVVVGLGLVALLLRRWTRHRRTPPPAVDAAMSERIRRELESEP
jgi:cytochrome c-type biogenesis protein CcmH